MKANPLGIYQPGGATPQQRAVGESVSFTLPSMGGRITVDSEQSLFRSAMTVLAPMSGDQYWRDWGLDSRTLDRISIRKLVELLADVSPDVSRAIWDFLRFCNPGWEVKVYELKSEEVINKKGQDAVDTFLNNLHGCYVETNGVPADVVIGSLFLGVFLRGAIFSELVLDETGKLPLEIATPDPATVKFMKVDGGVRGTVYQPGQWQNGQFIPFQSDTIAFIPIDPLPGKPEGRPMVNPAIFCSIFLIGLLHDLRRVVAQQGYPRIDLSVNVDELKKLMPQELNGNTQKTQEWFAATFRQIKDMYAQLEPDDAYVHFNAVEVKRPVGTIDASSLSGLDGLIKGLERMSVRALKSMPLLFGLSEGTSEANANRQWEIHVAGIKSIQHLGEKLLEKFLTIGLRVQGIAARVEFRFAELRAAELLRDAQVELMKIRNARAKFDNGWYSQDEAALEGAGKAKADVPMPRAVATNTAMPDTGNANSVDPGSGRKRSVESQTLLFTASNPPNQDEEQQAVDWYVLNAPDAAKDLIEPERVN